MVLHTNSLWITTTVHVFSYFPDLSEAELKDKLLFYVFEWNFRPKTLFSSNFVYKSPADDNGLIFWLKAGYINAL